MSQSCHVTPHACLLPPLPPPTAEGVHFRRIQATKPPDGGTLPRAALPDRGQATKLPDCALPRAPPCPPPLPPDRGGVCFS